MRVRPQSQNTLVLAILLSVPIGERKRLAGGDRHHSIRMLTKALEFVYFIIRNLKSRVKVSCSKPNRFFYSSLTRYRLD